LAAAMQRSPRYTDRPFRFDTVAVVMTASGAPAIRHVRGAFPSAY